MVSEGSSLGTGQAMDQRSESHAPPPPEDVIKFAEHEASIRQMLGCDCAGDYQRVPRGDDGGKVRVLTWGPGGSTRVLDRASTEEPPRGRVGLSGTAAELRGPLHVRDALRSIPESPSLEDPLELIPKTKY